MLQKLIELDQALFLLLNNLHAAWLDQPMFYISEKWFWIPFYAWLLYLIIKQHGINSFKPILSIALLILLCDQVSSSILKPMIHRLRPCHEPLIQPYIHLVNNYCGGKFGFVSSHAANSLGFSAYYIQFMHKKKPFTKWLLPIWTAVVAYSRIYLGAHYPGDILGGFAVGLFCYFLVIYLEQRVWRKGTY